MTRPILNERQQSNVLMRLACVVACVMAAERAFDKISAQSSFLLKGVGQELFKSQLDGPLGHWQPDSPDVKSLGKLAFFLDQGMNLATNCIACKPPFLDMPFHLREPTLDEWTIDEAHLVPQAHARPYIGASGSMQLVAMQVALTNIGTIDAVAGTFEAAFDFNFHWNGQLNITNNTACTFSCDATKQFCCDDVWVPRLRIANAKGKPLVTSVLVPWEPERRTAGPPSNYTMLHWNVQLEGTFNFDPDDRIFPMDQQNMALNLVNPYPSTTYFHYMQPEAASPSYQGWSRRSLSYRAALYNSRLQPRVNVAGPPSAAGWRMMSLTVARDCQRSVLPTFVQDINDFLTLVSQQADDSGSSLYPNQLFYGDQSQTLQAYINSVWKCPVFDSDVTIDKYTLLVSQTYDSYRECANSSFGTDGYPNRDVDALLNPVNMTCLLDSVANLTTASISVIITVRRTTAYYLVKLVVPMAVCVYIAFTAFALQVEDLASRLAIVGPAAVALTALQILVVATDVQAGACFIPTTALMLCSYAAQLLTALSSTFTYALWVGREAGKKLGGNIYLSPYGQQGSEETSKGRSRTPADAAACSGQAPRPKASVTRRAGPPSRLKTMGSSLLLNIPELNQPLLPKLRRLVSEPLALDPSAGASAPADVNPFASVPAYAGSSRHTSITKRMLYGDVQACTDMSPFRLLAEGAAWQSAGQDGGRLHLAQPAEPNLGRPTAGLQAEPQGSLATRAACRVVRWWMENQLPIRCLDFYLALTIVGLYTLCLVLSLIIPAILMRWRNVPPLGVVAQSFPS